VTSSSPHATVAMATATMSRSRVTTEVAFNALSLHELSGTGRPRVSKAPHPVLLDFSAGGGWTVVPNGKIIEVRTTQAGAVVVEYTLE